MSPIKLHSYLRPALLLCLVLWLLACSQPRQLELQGATMGTTYSIKLPRPPAGLDAQQLKSDIDALLASINSEMSTYDPDSRLSQINRAPADRWQQLPPRLTAVLQAAGQVHDLSLGVFDPTVGPLVNLWGFGPEEGISFPSPAAIQQARQRLGYRRLLRLDPEQHRLRKARVDVYIDLSAIAKGYAVDLVAELLLKRGVTEYLVEVGGELRLAGNNADNKPWRVAVERPVPGARQVHAVLNLTSGGVATSGDYRNFFEHAGRRYSHTIDPRTGYPVTHALASVTVVDASAMRADALATALLVLGPEEGMRLAKEQHLAVWMIVRDGEEWKDLRSPAMQAYQVN